MARCAACGTSILFGGRRAGDLVFCNDDCHRQAYFLSLASDYDDDLVEEHIRAVFEGPCPRCDGTGPVDVHFSHRVWSAVLVSAASSPAQITCRRCAVKAHLTGILFSFTLGWWGFPWGLIMTPIQIGRNVVGLIPRRAPTEPSQLLPTFVRMQLGAEVAVAIAQDQTRAADAGAAPEPDGQAS